MDIRKTGLIVAASMFAIGAWGAAPVADIAAVSTNNQAAVNQRAVAANPSADTYYLLQSLRDELRALRGMVEEQGNTIRLLKQRQVDDYLDLDRRLSGLSAGAGTTQRKAPKLTADQGSSSGGLQTDRARTSSPVLAVSSSGVDAAEKGIYEKAYSALKSGQVATAKKAFTDYLAKYPKGRYSANAYYWLGEIYMLDNQLKEAGEAFVVVVEQYPGHRKVLDASFKLGKVYHLQGQNEKAKTLLNKVALTKGSAGKLAANYLDANF